MGIDDIYGTNPGDALDKMGMCETPQDWANSTGDILGTLVMLLMKKGIIDSDEFNTALMRHTAFMDQVRTVCTRRKEEAVENAIDKAKREGSHQDLEEFIKKMTNEDEMDKVFGEAIMKLIKEEFGDSSA